MGFFTTAEIVSNSIESGKKKSDYPIWKMLLLGLLAGVILSFAATASSTVTFGIQNDSVRRLVSGLIFPLGLCTIIALGAELFTGGCLICISKWAKTVTWKRLLKSWLFVYVGNFAGSLLVAAGNAFAGQLNYGQNNLAVYTIKIAATKCSISLEQAIILGIFCNVLVCAGVLMSGAGKDMMGKMIGAYIPVALFVIAGFEHCIANMYYIPAGLFAATVPAYAQAATAGGIDIHMLTWGNFLLNNLLPVTIGNIIGGLSIGTILYLANKKSC